MTEQRLLADYVEYWARQNPHTIAVSRGAEVITYAELEDLVTRSAVRLRQCGLAVGDRVLLCGQNSPAWIVGFLAVLRARGIVVPVNSRLGKRQMPDLVRRTEPAMVLVDDSQVTLFDELPGDMADLRVHRVGEGAADALLMLGADIELSPSQPDEFGPRPEGWEPAILGFTSGTTSAPKAAVISHRSVVASAQAMLHFSKLDVRSRTTILVPLFHNTGHVDQMVQMLMSGGQIDLVTRFSSAAAVEALLRRPATFLVLVPSILRMLMLHDRADELLGQCATIGVGGAPMLPAWSLELAERWPQIELLHGYGLTEFTSASHVLPPEGVFTHPDSVGPPLPGVQCSIRDEHGKPLPPGEVGEVWLAGPMRMNEYWRDHVATQQAIDGDWLRTGDLGSVDEQDYLSLHGRRDDVINRGGEKIRPGTIEEILSEHSRIAQVVVVGIPDPMMGERVVAAIELRDSEPFDEVQATQLLTGRVPDYAHPDAYFEFDEMPLRQTGKLDRPLLRDRINDRLGVANDSR